MHSIASWATSMLTAALVLPIVPAGRARLMFSFTAFATDGASNGSSGIQASRAGGGSGFLTAFTGGGALPHAPRQSSPNDTDHRPSRVGQARRSVPSDIS